MLAGTTPIVLACWYDAGAPASSDASASCYGFPKDVGILAVVVTELKLREVQGQILLAYVVKTAHDAALEQAPERFDVVGVDLAPHVLASRVRYGVVLITYRFQVVIAAMLVCCDQINLVAHGSAHETIQGGRISVLDHLADDVAFATDSADHRGFATHAGDVLLFVPVTILVFAADAGFVDFNDTHKLLEIGIIHCRTQAMAHIPRGAVVAASDLTLNLKRADSLFGIEYLPENLEPSLQWIVRVFENGSRNYGEPIGVAAPASDIRALPFPRQFNLVDVIWLAATRAFNLAVRPTTLHQELLAGVVRRKGHHQFSEGHHEMKDNTSESIRQVPHNRPNLN